MTAQAAADRADDQNTAAFAFVQSLAAELSEGNIDLPSFPDVAIRVRMVLADERSTVDTIVRVTSAEPILATRLLRMANSVALNPTGHHVNDLRTAINRVGHNIVRSAAISFAMEQIRRAESLTRIRPKLEELWEESTHVAAVAYLLAKRFTTHNPDQALLTGMLHNVGKLYIQTRLVGHPLLFRDHESQQAITRDWHASIGMAILENWGLPDEVCEAVRDHEDIMRTHRGAADLTDITTAAVILSQIAAQSDGLQPNLQELKAFRVIGLDNAGSQQVIRDMQEEIAALRQALGGP
jgi:HD-like signal output (HDOD) protein